MIPRTLFSAEHELFRDTVRRFIAEHVTPHHQAWEAAGEVPRALWHEAGRLGLLCCNVPEVYGGMGGDFLHSTLLVEEFAAAGATGPTFYLQSDIIAPYLVDFGTEEQKQRWLPPMVRGEVASHESEFYITECTWMRKHGWRAREAAGLRTITAQACPGRLMSSV